ncbi:hypothetical protein SAMN02910456_01062 [Ruminococcaceae bacterium YRB3002]|nr:hypothetical protein SAMN02910456_01062 [Ruminococcaceae bacterium YRB3002]
MSTVYYRLDPNKKLTPEQKKMLEEAEKREDVYDPDNPPQTEEQLKEFVRVGNKKHVTIYLDQVVIDYFKGLAVETDIPYQTLINMYLRHCADDKIKPDTKWKKTG